MFNYFHNKLKGFLILNLSSKLVHQVKEICDKKTITTNS